MRNKDQHVIAGISGGWAVRRTGAERASKVFSQKVDAVKHARNLAEREGSGLYIHAKDGSVESSTSTKRTAPTSRKTKR